MNLEHMNQVSDSLSEAPNQNQDINTQRGLLDDQQMMENQDFIDNDSDESADRADGDTMNTFGFNDDLNLDDRVIFKNPTINQDYNMVERTKYLLQFEQQESEQEFAYLVSQQESKKNTWYLVILAVQIKVLLISHSF